MRVLWEMRQQQPARGSALLEESYQAAQWAELAAAPALGAQMDADGWVLLHSAPVETESGTQVLTMPDGSPRTLAIRLSAKGGPVSLSRVVVTYGNGQTHFENWPKNQPVRLAAGEHTKPIDQRNEARIVDTVALSFEPSLHPTKV